MASKSLILALALATTAGAKGIRGLNFGNYYDNCVTTDVETENKCQDYSCRPGATLGANEEFGAAANCGENYPAYFRRNRTSSSARDAQRPRDAAQRGVRKPWQYPKPHLIKEVPLPLVHRRRALPRPRERARVDRRGGDFQAPPPRRRRRRRVARVQ